MTEGLLPEKASYILMFVIAVIVSFSIIKGLSIVLNTDLPLAIVSSWSMEPTLHIGDMIVVRGEEANIGDIVVYTREKYIVHRVISKSYQNGIYVITTKGDANIASDNPITSKQVKGKVVLVIPYLGIIKLINDRVCNIMLLTFAVMVLSAKNNSMK